jgi:nitric oxide dioxygenase
MRITRHPLLPPNVGLRNIPPDEGVIDRLRRSMPLIESSSTEIIDRFLARLSRVAPLLATRLAGAHDQRSAQRHRLVETLQLVVDNLRSIETVQRHVHELGRKNAPGGIRSHEYAVAVEQLVDAMADAIGPRFTPEFAQEWRRALELLGAMLREGAGQTVSGLERALEESRG